MQRLSACQGQFCESRRFCWPEQLLHGAAKSVSGLCPKGPQLARLWTLTTLAPQNGQCDGGSTDWNSPSQRSQHHTLLPKCRSASLSSVSRIFGMLVSIVRLVVFLVRHSTIFGKPATSRPWNSTISATKLLLAPTMHGRSS
jgi:hypothetical protein